MTTETATKRNTHSKNESSQSTLCERDLTVLNDAFYGTNNTNNDRFYAKSLHRNPTEGLEDIDRIERYLQHLKYSCKLYSGLDVYQILAFRRFHPASRRFKKTKPFKLLRCNCEIKLHSDFIDAIVTAFIIGLLQIVGISVILGETVSAYFDIDNDRAGCEYDGNAWREDGYFKILAMLFAAMISIQLNKTIQLQRHSGFNELLSSIDEKDFGKIYFVDISMIQFGLLINVYTLFCAVGGSFFLIYASEGGSESLDMVLNSISLFFMVNLDDLLVSVTDYEDVEDCINEFWREYEKNKQIDAPKDDISAQCCGYKGLCICDRIVDIIQFVLVSLTYVGGAIAPFVIAVCW